MSPGSYEETYARSLADPEAFWSEAARATHWYEPWDRTLDRDASPLARWFVGGRWNTCQGQLPLGLVVRAGDGDEGLGDDELVS